MKLTPAQVVSIRERFAAGEVGPALAHEFGVTKQCISLIVRGDQHADVGGPRTRQAGCGRRQRITDSQARTLRCRAAAGADLGELAQEFGISRSVAQKIATGVTYRRAGGPLSRRYALRAGHEIGP